MIGALQSERIESYDITGQFETIQIFKTDYPYFTYRWENITENHPNYGMVYIGFHKGKPWDGYWQTSKNPKFARDFANTKVKWDYQILRYDQSEKEAKRYEGHSIRKMFKNEKCRSYNMHPGVKEVIDFQKVESMFNSIQLSISENGKDIEEVDLDYLKKLKGVQIRVVEYPDKIKYIANSIDDEMGAITHTDPIVVGIDENDVCNVGSVEQRLNGRHTQKGILKSKHAVGAKIIKVDVTDWTKEEIEHLAFILNPDDKVKKEGPKLEDYEKRLMTLYVDGKMDDPTSFIAEKIMVPLTSKDAGKVVRNVKKLIEEKNHRDTYGKVWRHYGNGLDEEAKESLKKQAKQAVTGLDRATTVKMSSKKFSLDTIIKKLSEEDENTGETLYNHVAVLIHHPYPQKENKIDWQSRNLQTQMKMIKRFIENKHTKATVDVIELDYYKEEIE